MNSMHHFDMSSPGYPEPTFWLLGSWSAPSEHLLGYVPGTILTILWLHLPLEMGLNTWKSRNWIFILLLTLLDHQLSAKIQAQLGCSFVIAARYGLVLDINLGCGGYNS